MDHSDIQDILRTMGMRVPPFSRLVLLGGSALLLLGSPRQTLDIDFIGDDVHPNELHQLIIQIAKELKIHVEPVPLDEFIPIPMGSEERTIHMGPYGNLEIYIADPYSIAISKLDRGFETDIEDIVFLAREGYIDLAELERLTQEAIHLSHEYDLDPDMLHHLQDLKDQFE